MALTLLSLYITLLSLYITLLLLCLWTDMRRVTNLVKTSSGFLSTVKTFISGTLLSSPNQTDCLWMLHAMSLMSVVWFGKMLPYQRIKWQTLFRDLLNSIHCLALYMYMYCLIHLHLIACSLFVDAFDDRYEYFLIFYCNGKYILSNSGIVSIKGMNKYI